MKIVDLSIQRPVTIFIFALAAVVFGAVAFIVGGIKPEDGRFLLVRADSARDGIRVFKAEA